MINNNKIGHVQFRFMYDTHKEVLHAGIWMGGKEFNREYMVENDRAQSIMEELIGVYEDIIHPELSTSKKSRTKIEQTFIEVYEEFRVASDAPGRINTFRYLGSLETLWCLITDNVGKPLPYASHQYPTWFGMGSKVRKEKYVDCIMRISRNLYNKLKYEK